jgi:alpha-N-acetylglucosamine transferase|tara:strand:+ start:286 stop:1107 length:822 start_codon:yes stop_codon:yes gene_type:complete
MSKGICLFAQKNEKSDYYKQAVACAMSIKAFNPKEQICLITDMKVKTEHEKYFDVTKDIPGNDLSINSNWKIENRCKIYNASPFDRTIVLDVDMLVLESLDNFWNLLEPYELFYTNKVKTYRNEIATGDFYRKVFVHNQLPNVYCGLHYFKKTKSNQDFYNLVTDIVKNYKEYSERFAKNLKQSWCSMDVATAIAIKLTNKEHQVFSNSNVLTFTHMKPKIQNWKADVQNWTAYIDYNLNKNKELAVGNIHQTGIFHYVVDNFLNDDVMENLK